MWCGREPRALPFGESRTGKAPEALSPDKTDRNRCEGPWDVEEPGNHSRKLQPVLASLCVLGHFAHLLWASVSSSVRWRDQHS